MWLRSGSLLRPRLLYTASRMLRQVSIAVMTPMICTSTQPANLLLNFGLQFIKLCNYKVVNPGLDAAQFDSFDTDDEATDPIEDEHHAIFACSGYVYARQLFQDLFRINLNRRTIP